MVTVRRTRNDVFVGRGRHTVMTVTTTGEAIKKGVKKLLHLLGLLLGLLVELLDAVQPDDGDDLCGFG